MRDACVRNSLALFLMAGCGGDMGTADAAVDGGLDLNPVSVDTAAPETAFAGQALNISCLVIDESGETFALPAGFDVDYRFVPADSVEQLEDGSWIATQAGQLEIACALPDYRLTDETPAIVEITPGDPAYVVTHLALDSIEAGEYADVSCEVFDAWGNPIYDASPGARSEPAHEGNTFADLEGHFTHAGEFDVYCDLPGAVSHGETLEVRPGLPADLVISRVPYQPVYARGQVIDLHRAVSDRFGNPIPDALVPVTSDPAGEQLGDGRFRYLADGRYLLTARVAPPTEGDIPLEHSTYVVVDGNGPAISCDAPFDGEVLDRTPTGTINFRGTIADLSGVREARVNGSIVSVNAAGRFEAEIPLRYGINFVDISATDTTGRESSQTCSFLVADTWAPDDRSFADTLTMRLRQTALDDMNRADGLDSLTDILHTMLNSPELRNGIHRSLAASPVLKPSGCDARVFGICVLRSEVIYQDLRINGPNPVALTLVDGGMRAEITINDLRLRVRVRGHVAGISYDTTGWVTFSSIGVSSIFNTTVSGGRPQVSVRPGSVRTSVGTIRTDFSGISGSVIDILVSLFNGTVRSLVAGLVRDFVTGDINDILDGLFGGLDVSGLGSTFDVPRLDGAGAIPLSFGLGFSTLNSTSSRMIFGIGTRFFTPPTHARPTLGAPSRGGTRWVNVSGAESTAVAIHESLLNQALYALWRGGFFDATLGSESIAGSAPGVRATMELGLPPVVEITPENRVRISLGGLGMDLYYPELFAAPIRVNLGVRASLAAGLVGEDIDFGDARIDELVFSTNIASLDMGTRDTIEAFLTRLLTRILVPALNDALPAIPIPSFELPSSVSAYGLPVGARMGIVSPYFSMEPPHFSLRGDFAVR